jgi:hypothetical protein
VSGGKTTVTVVCIVSDSAYYLGLGLLSSLRLFSRSLRSRQFIFTDENCDVVYLQLGIVSLSPIKDKYVSKLHTYHSSFNPEGVADRSQIFLRNAQVLQNYLAMTNCRRDR